MVAGGFTVWQIFSQIPHPTHLSALITGLKSSSRYKASSFKGHCL